MSRKLWSGILRTSSPRFADWSRILGDTKVPIVNPRPYAMELGEEGLQNVLSLDLERLERAQVQRLLEFMVDRFGLKPRQAKKVLEADGFLIRAEDVIVSHDAQAFL